MISKNSFLRAITALCLSLSLWVLFFYCPSIILSCLIIIAMGIMIQELKNMLHGSPQFFMLVPFYPITPCLFLIYFNQTITYKNLLFHLIVLVFTFDSASYLAGKICSKLWITHKVIPAISPGKSWEGACGGFIATTIVVMMIIKKISLLTILLSATICSIAFTGDIFESYLKRSAGIKDSGTILPGHGGLLDRLDAILFVSYFFFIFKNYLVIVFI